MIMILVILATLGFLYLVGYLLGLFTNPPEEGW